MEVSRVYIEQHMKCTELLPLLWVHHCLMTAGATGDSKTHVLSLHEAEIISPFVQNQRAPVQTQRPRWRSTSVMVTVMAVTAWRTRMSFPPLMTSKVPVQTARRMKRLSEPSGDLQGVRVTLQLELIHSGLLMTVLHDCKADYTC